MKTGLHRAILDQDWFELLPSSVTRQPGAERIWSLFHGNTSCTFSERGHVAAENRRSQA